MPIKIFHAGQAGAPSLQGQSGSLITVLDAILVNGYNSVSVTSITRSGGTATLTASAAHGLATGDVALVAGAAQTDYNIEAVVTVTSSTVFTYTVANSPTTPATGTITVKRAPAGFAKTYSGTNKAAYRSNDTGGTRPYLQIIDDASTTGAAREAKTRGYLTMTDVDTGSEPFPTAAQMTNGLFTYKSSTADTVNRPWVLITDGKTFYFQTSMDQSPAGMQASGGYLWFLGFGDILSSRPTDSYKAFLAACSAVNQQVTTTSASCVNGMLAPAVRTANPSVGGCYVVRSYTQVTGAAVMNQMGHGWDQNALGVLGIFPYPHTPDNGFMMSRMLCMQGGVLRGFMPGVYESLHGRVLDQFEVIENVDGFTGRKFMALWGRNASGTADTGCLLFDITGPWT